jgi:anti-sigma B factor antagonist
MDAATGLISFERKGDVTLGTIVGTKVLDGTHTDDFGREGCAYVKGKPGLNLLLDFRNITYLSSAALTELLRIREALHREGGTIRLCCLSCEIQRVFRITNLEKLFHIHGDEDTAEAVARFQRALDVAAREGAWVAQDAGA